jgi:hypothetical protein
MAHRADHRVTNWAAIRIGVSVIAGSAALIFGILKSDAAMMTVGAGLIGFSPAAKGPMA